MHETNNLVVLNQDNIPTTTSLKVAETFEKEHSNILKAICPYCETT